MRWLLILRGVSPTVSSVELAVSADDIITLLAIPTDI